MKRRDVEFTSRGETCRGMFLTPDDGGNGPYPTVVMAGGWCYVKEIVMPHYAKYFVDRGIAALIFDYRNLGESDGDNRQHLDPWEQIEDYQNAITYLETLPEVDSNRIGAWGISYSGGHVLILGALDSRVKCIVSNIPVVDGYENERRIHGEAKFAELLDLLMEDRRNRYKTGVSARIPHSPVDPTKELSGWPFPEVQEIFNEIKRTEAPNHLHESTVESVEQLLAYNVFPYLKRIVNTPTLMIVAEGDNITLWDLEIEAYTQILSQRKKLYVLPKTTHMSLYNNQVKLEKAALEAAEWFETYLKQASPDVVATASK